MAQGLCESEGSRRLQMESPCDHGPYSHVRAARWPARRARARRVDERDSPLFVHIETTGPRATCPGRGETATVKERDIVELVDLPAFGRRNRLVWRKHRWRCPNQAAGG